MQAPPMKSKIGELNVNDSLSNQGLSMKTHVFRLMSLKGKYNITTDEEL